MSDWTNWYWPRSGDRGSVSSANSSRRTSARRRGSRSSTSVSATAARPAGVKLYPTTAASWTRARSAGSRASSRDAMRDRSVSGTAIRRGRRSVGRCPPPARGVPRRGAPGRSRRRRAGCRRRARRSSRSPGRAGPGTNPTRSSRITAGGRGSSASDVEFRVWVPHPGRRSNSSGRVSVTTRSGRPRDHSRTWSMKSSRPVSAHWRSSNSRTVVPRSAIRSKNSRHAPKSAPRPPAGAGSSPSNASSAGSTKRRSSSSGTYSATVSRDPPARRRLVVVLGQPGAPADHLAERPEGDALAVRRRPTPMPVDVLDDAVDVLLELPGEPALADAARARHRHEPRPPIATRRLDEVLQDAELLVTADERRLGQVRTSLTATLGDHPERPPGWHRRGLALELLGADGLEGDRRGRRVHRRLADEHAAGGGDRLEAGGGVDDVADDHPLPHGADVDRRLAGQDPGPRLEPGRERRDGGQQVERGADGPLGVVLAGDRRAPHGHDRVADELLDGPAVSLDQPARRVVEARQQLASILGVLAFGEARVPDEIREQDGHEAPLRDRRGGRGPCRGRGRGAGHRRCAGPAHPGCQRRPARAAELLAWLRGAAAAGARRREWRPALDAERPSRLVLGVTARAAHRSPGAPPLRRCSD